MNENEKIVVLRSKLEEIRNLSSVERELRLCGIFQEYLDNGKNADTAMIDMLPEHISLNSKVFALRETLLENLCGQLKSVSADDFTASDLRPVVSVLVKLFDQRITFSEVIAELKSYDEKRTELISADGNMNQFAEITEICYTFVSRFMEFWGIPLSVIEAAALEFPDADYGCTLSSLISQIENDDSEYRKMVALTQIMTMVSSIYNIST